MIWIGLSVLLCAVLCYMIIKKVERINMLVSSQCLDIFNLKQAFGEFQKDSDYRLTEWGKELKVCILSLQADVLRSKIASPIKEVIEEKKRQARRPLSEEAKKKQAERRRELRAQKKEAEQVNAPPLEIKKVRVRAPSFFNNYTATEVEESSSDLK